MIPALANSKMKLMLFSHTCSPSFITGAEKLLLFFAMELMEGCECIIVVPTEGVLAERARAAGICTYVHYCPMLYALHDPDPSLFAGLKQMQRTPEWRMLLRLIQSCRPDAVVTVTCVNALPAVAAKRFGIPTVWMITEKLTDNESTRLSVELIDRHADWIVGISQTTLQPFRTIGVANTSKLKIMPPSWRAEDLSPALWPQFRQARRASSGWTEADRVVGYISSAIYPNKGLEHFVGMALRLCGSGRFPETKFMIVGKPTDEAYFGRCLEAIAQSGCGDRFRCVSFEPDIGTIYPAMDIVVIPSIASEGFGMTALEGLIFGKPVVVYRSGGLAEILEATSGGRFIVENGDITGLTSRVAELLANEILRLQTGEHNRMAAAAAFGIETYRDRLRRFVPLLEGMRSVRRGSRQAKRRRLATMRKRKLQVKSSRRRKRKSNSSASGSRRRSTLTMRRRR